MVLIITDGSRLGTFLSHSHDSHSSVPSPSYTSVSPPRLEVRPQAWLSQTERVLELLPSPQGFQESFSVYLWLAYTGYLTVNNTYASKGSNYSCIFIIIELLIRVGVFMCVCVSLRLFK